MANMTDNDRASRKAKKQAKKQAADDPVYLHLISLFSTFHISNRTMTETPKMDMNSLPSEVILKIASYFYDDYTFCKLTNDIWIETTNQPTKSAAATPGKTSAPTYHFICPYAAFAMTNRYLWSVIPRKLRHPILPTTIDEAKAYLRIRGEREQLWARKYMKRSGSKRETGVGFQGLADTTTV